MRQAAGWLVFVALLLWISFGGSAGTLASPAPSEQSAGSPSESPIELRLGGAGGVYFLAEPGELVVEVEKRDRNRRGVRTELRAILVAPDRTVLQDVTIPDDGQPRGKLGPPGRARLATRVQRKGVYALNVTISQDRYGEEILWGFRTNCPRYLIETSRGHRDEPHQEPIVLENADRPGNVCFLPRTGAYRVELANLPKSAKAVSVYNGRGRLIRTLQVDASGRAAGEFPADVHREAVPWRLALPAMQATVHIDGVTRWDRQDLYPNLCLWTPDPAAFFPLAQYRWLLTPYRRTAYGPPGERGEIAFQVHNNSERAKIVRLDIEFPDSPWDVRLDVRQVVLRPKQSQKVRLCYTVPAAGQSRQCHLRATPAEDQDFSTYSTLTVKAGEPPAARPLHMPLVLTPYCHENEQFGYLPDYPVEYEMYFDMANRPWTRTAAGVETWRDGRWSSVDLGGAESSSTRRSEDRSFRLLLPKIAFDQQGGVYMLAAAGGQVSLLHSADGGKTFSAYAIPARQDRPCAWDVEQFSGHNVADGPPPILRYSQTAADPRLIWRRINDLELFVPKNVNGRLVLGEPILISRNCIGLAAHSGSPSGVVSRGEKVHVVWAEATDPAEKVPGVPTYVATYDRATGSLGKPVLVAYGPPPNDVHNSPSITMDSQGVLHVVAGTHGQPFPYTHSLKPNTANSGWTKAVPVGEGLRQTYTGLVCGPDDTLHLAYRLWRSGDEPFPASHHATLAYQRKPPGKPWEPPRVLIVPPLSEYSVYYHRLTIDRRGRLLLSYDYWSTYWFYRMDHFGNRRAVLMSPDGGATWKLALTADLTGF